MQNLFVENSPRRSVCIWVKSWDVRRLSTFNDWQICSERDLTERMFELMITKYPLISNIADNLQTACVKILLTTCSFKQLLQIHWAQGFLGAFWQMNGRFIGSFVIHVRADKQPPGFVGQIRRWSMAQCCDLRPGSCHTAAKTWESGLMSWTGPRSAESRWSVTVWIRFCKGLKFLSIW